MRNGQGEDLEKELKEESHRDKSIEREGAQKRGESDRFRRGDYRGRSAESDSGSNRGGKGERSTQKNGCSKGIAPIEDICMEERE